MEELCEKKTESKKSESFYLQYSGGGLHGAPISTARLLQQCREAVGIEAFGCMRLHEVGQIRRRPIQQP